jgi:hypothetical protein
MSSINQKKLLFVCDGCEKGGCVKIVNYAERKGFNHQNPLFCDDCETAKYAERVAALLESRKCADGCGGCALEVGKCEICDNGKKECDCDECGKHGCFECLSFYSSADKNLCDECAEPKESYEEWSKRTGKDKEWTSLEKEFYNKEENEKRFWKWRHSGGRGLPPMECYCEEDEKEEEKPIREDSFFFNTKCVCGKEGDNDYPCLCDIHEDEAEEQKKMGLTMMAKSYHEEYMKEKAAK